MKQEEEKKRKEKKRKEPEPAAEMPQEEEPEEVLSSLRPRRVKHIAKKSTAKLHIPSPIKETIPPTSAPTPQASEPIREVINSYILTLSPFGFLSRFINHLSI